MKAEREMSSRNNSSESSKSSVVLDDWAYRRDSDGRHRQSLLHPVKSFSFCPSRMAVTDFRHVVRFVKYEIWLRGAWWLWRVVWEVPQARVALLGVERNWR